ncbi:MAG: hypothetical protein M1819_001141 [Sarea resinae]|nr:MAG: hypothetical protein M1819_001141 [Sarea resinae]
MVTTRTRSQALAAGLTPNGSPKSPQSEAKKRETGTNSSPGSGSRKRRRVELEETATSSPTMGPKYTTSSRNNVLPLRSKDGAAYEEVQDSDEAASGSEHSTIHVVVNHIQHNGTAETAEEGPAAQKPEPNQSLDELIGTAAKSHASGSPLRPRSRKGDAEPIVTKNVVGKTTLKAKPVPVEDEIKATPKKNHVRFGNEDPQSSATLLGDGNPELSINGAVTDNQAKHHEEYGSDEDEDEDEAPEAVTLAAGMETAQAKATEAAKAAQRQEQAIKKKRQERDLRLKQQAESSKRTKKRKLESTEPSNETPLDVTPDAPIPNMTSRSALPALLPDELLAAEPVIRPPTPDAEPGSRRRKQNHKLFATEEKPPKDVRRGGVNVRVLEVGQNRLPPKGSKTSKSIKESWLSGRGRHGVVERRKMGGGFLRH